MANYGGDNAMTEYLKFLDLKEIVNGIIGGAILLGIVAAWAHFTVRGNARRLKNSEAYAAKIAKLAGSDTALLIYGFQGIFAIVGLLCLIFAMQDLAFHHPHVPIELEKVPKLFLWLLPGLVCLGFVWALQNVSDYPKSVEKLERKIEKLKSNLTQNRQPGS